MSSGIRHFETYVAGVRYKNADGRSRQAIIRKLECFDRLVLRREPGNPHDTNAVKICRTNGTQVGYLPRDLAGEVAPRLDQGWRYGVFVLRINEDFEESDDEDGREILFVDLIVVEARPNVSDAKVERYLELKVRPQLAEDLGIEKRPTRVSLEAIGGVLVTMLIILIFIAVRMYLG